MNVVPFQQSNLICIIYLETHFNHTPGHVRKKSQEQILGRAKNTIFTLFKIKKCTNAIKK